jgi:hypothetical protein
LLHGHDDVHFNPGRVACRKAPRTRKHGEDDRCASLRRARAEVHARGGRETLRLLCAWSWRAKRADESERRVGPKRTQRCRVRASCVCATWWLVRQRTRRTIRCDSSRRRNRTSFVRLTGKRLDSGGNHLPKKRGKSRTALLVRVLNLLPAQRQRPKPLRRAGRSCRAHEAKLGRDR